MARYWSWVSNEFGLLQEGKPVVQALWIRSLTASDAAESALVRGAGRFPFGTTDPQYVPGEGSIEVLMASFRAWTREATDNGAEYLGDLDFTLNIKRKSKTETDAMIDVVKFQFTNWEDSQEQGTADPLVSSLSLQILSIERNGVIL